MDSVLFLFIILSAIGLVLSIVAHLASLVGLPIPGGKFVWSLHIGIFVVWFPAIIVAHRASRGRPQRKLWTNVLSGLPSWVRYAVYTLFAYAMLNFLLFLDTTGSAPQPEGDAPPAVIRGFSGHWMLFYGAAFAILLSAYRSRRLLEK